MDYCKLAKWSFIAWAKLTEESLGYRSEKTSKLFSVVFCHK